MEYLVSSYGNDILKAYSNLKPGDTLTVDVACRKTPLPTMECLLALQGTGTIQHGLITANTQQKCLLIQQITKAANSPLVLTDWSAS